MCGVGGIMILEILSVRDSAANAFGRPVFAVSVGAALRSFSDEVNRKADDNVLHRHPGDHELFHLGNWDDLTAKFSLFDSPKSIATGRTVFAKE